MPQEASLEDLKLAQGVVRGEAEALQVFLTKFRPAIEKTLAMRCKDLATKPAVHEVTTELLGDCMVAHLDDGEANGAPPASLLHKYLNPRPDSDGNPRVIGPLEAWLRRVALHRLFDWIDDHELDSASLVEVKPEGGESGEPGGASEGEELVEEAGRDGDVIELLKQALELGFANAAKKHPLGFLSLKLVWLFSVQRQQVSVAWQRNQARTAEWMEKAMQTIRHDTMRHLHKADPLLLVRWKDLLAICAKYPEIIRGPE